MAKGEIKVTYSDLEAAINDINKVAQEVESRKIDIKFSKSKGSFAKEMLKMADDLEEYGKLVSNVYARCGAALQYGLEEFEYQDNFIGLKILLGGK